MINRILIRIKVVQMLYSYLLVEKDFSIEPQPAAPTKEKRFAHALYLDTLVLMTKVADNITRRGGDKPLMQSRFISALLADDRIRPLLIKYQAEPFPFADAVMPVAEAVKDSALYKNYLKDNADYRNTDVDIWRDIYNLIMADSKIMASLASRRENYTLRGVEIARQYIDNTFADFYSSHTVLSDAVKMLRRSFDAARELYFRLLILPVEITRVREIQLDLNRHKYIRTGDDLNPNLRFIENRLVKSLATNPLIEDYCKNNKLSWLTNDRYLLELLLKEVMESDVYKQYMEFPASDYSADTDLWRELFKQIIFKNETFLAELEDKSVFWNDDVEIIGTFLLKTLKRFDDANAVAESGGTVSEPVLPMFKDDEDRSFGEELISFAIRNKDNYRRYIDRHINKSHWDTERIPFMDIVILFTAIAEVLNFPKIPASVTVNEYIEIAKYYSTNKSASFIHGILGSIIKTLSDEGVLNKN